MNKLTRSQKRSLHFYLAFKDKNPTVLGIIAYNARLYLLSLLLVSVWIGYAYLAADWFAFGWMTALVFGAFARDIGKFIKTVRFWPITREITNWDKVTSFLEKDNNKSGDE